MVVSCHDHVTFYSSENLKKWTKESEFGTCIGSHDGVWECPDLFPLKIQGTNKTKWILTVNSSGSLAEGRSTQYFIGNFNGQSFTVDDHKTRWLDDGADEYAGITWNHTGNRVIFIGWIDNWPSANKEIPSYIWRGAMTLPMELRQHTVNGTTAFVAKQPAEELKGLEHVLLKADPLKISSHGWDKDFPGDQLASSTIGFTARMNTANKLVVSLKNGLEQHVDIIYNKSLHRLTIDRSEANRAGFQAESNLIHSVDIPEDISSVPIQIFYDHSIIEVFFDDGRWHTTDLVFPGKLFNKLQINMTGEGV